MNIWKQAQEVKLNLSSNIESGFDINFGKGVSEELASELIKFTEWVQDNYNVPIIVLIDFVNKNYVLNEEKKRCGYLLYYVDFENYPEFNNLEEVPYMVVPVKGYNEKWSLKDILGSFVEGMTDYFLWILNKEASEEEFEATVQEILDEYFK